MFFKLSTFIMNLSLLFFTDDEQVSAVWGTTVDVLFAVTWSPPGLGWAGLKRLTERQTNGTHHQLRTCLPPPLGSPSSSPSPALKHHGGWMTLHAKNTVKKRWRSKTMTKCLALWGKKKKKKRLQKPNWCWVRGGEGGRGGGELATYTHKLHGGCC